MTKPKHPRRRNKLYFIVLFVMGILLSGGCNKVDQKASSPPAPRVKVAQKSTPIQSQSSSVTVQPKEVSSLDFSTRKDPFKPYVVVTIQDASSVTRSDLLPIQSYEVTKFKVAGIIVGLKENHALVVDPAGKGYVIKEGMLIGDHDGVVTKITATTIDVLEKYRDEFGKMKSSTVKLTLPQKK